MTKAVLLFSRSSLDESDGEKKTSQISVIFDRIFFAVKFTDFLIICLFNCKRERKEEKDRQVDTQTEKQVAKVSQQEFLNQLKTTNKGKKREYINNNIIF